MVIRLMAATANRPNTIAISMMTAKKNTGIQISLLGTTKPMVHPVW